MKRRDGALVMAASFVSVAACAALCAISAMGVSAPVVAVADADCRPGLRNAPEQVRRLVSMLARTAAGRRVLARIDEPLMACVGQVPMSAIMADGTLILDVRDTDAEAAARLGHLLLHEVEGMPQIAVAGDGRSCDRLVDEAIAAEARAHALELELRRELGVTRPRRPYPFERDFWAAGGHEERVEALERYFRSHPGDSDEAPGFVEAYRRGCEERTRERTRQR